MSEPTSAELRAEARRLSTLAREVEKAEARERRLALEARRPKMPAVPAEGRGVNPVIRFSKYMSGHSYDYAAIGWRDGQHVRWAVTGHTSGRFNWNGLLEFVGEANWATIHTMTEEKRLCTPEDEPPVMESMGSYGMVTGTARVTNPFGI